MKCNECIEKLSAYSDHMLNEEELEQVSAHLVTCPNCQRELKALETMLQSLKELQKTDDVEVPTALHKDITKRIVEEKQGIKKKPISYFKRPYVGGMVAVFIIGAIFIKQSVIDHGWRIQYGQVSKSVLTGAEESENKEESVSAAPRMASEVLDEGQPASEDSSHEASAADNNEINEDVSGGVGPASRYKMDPASSEEVHTANYSEASIASSTWTIETKDKQAVVLFLKDYSKAHNIEISYSSEEGLEDTLILYNCKDQKDLIALLKEDEAVISLTEGPDEGQDVTIFFR